MQVSSPESASYCSIILQTTPVLLDQLGSPFIAWLGTWMFSNIYYIALALALWIYQNSQDMKQHTVFSVHCSYRFISLHDFPPDKKWPNPEIARW